MLADFRTALSRFIRSDAGALSADWAFITVGGGVMGIVASGTLVTAGGGLSEVMRDEVGAPAPELVATFEELAGTADDVVETAGVGGIVGSLTNAVDEVVDTVVAEEDCLRRHKNHFHDDCNGGVRVDSKAAKDKKDKKEVGRHDPDHHNYRDDD